MDNKALRAQVRRRLRRIDPFVRYMLFNWLLGAIAGFICATAVLIVDPFRLRPVLDHTDAAAAAVVFLYLGFVTTFGGVLCAAAILFPHRDDDPPGGGGLRGNVSPALAFVRVAADRRT